MKLVTLDFETYYDQDYSLKKMTTEAYIRDPRFEVIGCAVKFGRAPTDWMTAYKGRLETVFRKIDWSNCAVLAHNTRFDGAILEWRYGVRPAFYFDTLSMARALHGVEGALSLDALTQRYGLGQKGDEVVAAKGKRLADFGSADLARYGDYCANDVELTLKLFDAMRSRGDWQYPTQELAVIDLMLRMFIRPTIQLDKDALQVHLDTVVRKKELLLERVEEMAGKDALMSNDKLAALLRRMGVEPPMKFSPSALKRGEEKLTYAFGKTDLEFKALLDHEDERVQAIVAARMGVKSTQAETRAQRFIEMSERGPMPVPLNYYAAHTGRAGGDDKVNLQNLPSRTGDLSLRRSLTAPPDHSIVTCDSAQIEARVLAHLAGQADLVEDFRNGVDIYSSFASEVYGYKVDRKMTAVDENGKVYNPHKIEGMVGKECLAGWTPVLTPRGWVPITQVTLSDLVWDGVEWVRHDGLIHQGTKETLWKDGLCATPDHEILTDSGWREWHEVSTDKTLSRQALVLGASLCCDTRDTRTAGGGLRGSRWLSALVDGWGRSTIAAWRTGFLRAVKGAARRLLPQSGTGSTKPRWTRTPVEHAYSTASAQHCAGATERQTKTTSTTARGAYTSTRSGTLTKPRSSPTSKPSTAGMFRSWRWTALTSIAAMNPATSGSARAPRIWRIGVGLKTLRSVFVASKQRCPVYDLANAGPRHRFTVLTAKGPVVVSNCILGLGFGMGGGKFQLRLKQSVGIDMDEAQAINVVNIYRRKFAKIKALWGSANEAIKQMIRGYTYTLGVGVKLPCFPADEWGPARIQLPNGMFLFYPELRATEGGKYGVEYKYTQRKGRKVETVFIHGAKLIENVVQALARIIVFEQLVVIDRWMQKQEIAPTEHLTLAMTVHDEGDAIAPDRLVEVVEAKMLSVMKTPPSWANDIPISAEAAHGKNYGDA